MESTIKYTLIRSNRKTISGSVSADGTIVVRAPMRLEYSYIDDFVIENIEWFEKERKRLEGKKPLPSPDSAETERLKIEAWRILPEITAKYAAIMGVKPTGIKITAARKRFGSCNSKKSICFSCFLMLQHEKVIEYVVVHELAHIKYMNHSAAFYNYIAEYLPDYEERIGLMK